MSTPEGKVKAKILTLLKRYGVWYCFPATHGYGRSGVPDLLICHQGRFIAIEVKATEKNDPTALQKIELDKIAAAGGIALVIHEGSIEGLHRIFDPTYVPKEPRQ